MKKIALIFPGQGSQYVGMGKEICNDFEEARSVYEEAKEALNLDISELCFADSLNRLNQTEFTQPAILTTSIAIFRVLEKNGGHEGVGIVAGHSLGEYTAAVAAGGIKFSDAIKLVAKRGQYMQSAVPDGKGAMAAIIGLSRDDVEQICKEASVAKSSIVTPANYNCPGQIVIAGLKDGVDLAMELCKQKGAKRVMTLAVSVPSHSPLMKPAADKLESDMNEIIFNNLKTPLVTNAEAREITDMNDVKKSLIKQITSPLLWEDCVEYIVGSGINTFIEFGPQRILSGLVRRINKDLTIFNVEDRKSLDQTLEGLSKN